MHAVLDRGEPAQGSARFHASFPPAPRPLACEPPPPVASSFGADRGPNWSVFGIIALLHAVALFALVKLDVISIHHDKKAPLVIELIAEQKPPPPTMPEKVVDPIKPTVEQIVTPPPVVSVPVQTPPPVVTAPTPPPPQAVAVAPTVKADPGPPAPITPPDASAASLNNPSPRYPIESRRKREEGTVRLRVMITVDGRVKEISVSRSSGFERLDKAALDAVRRWKFKPGMQAGTPVEAIGFLNIPFKIAD